MEIADPETTVPEEMGVDAIPMLMNPPYFLPWTNLRGTSMLGVGEENTWTLMT